MRVESHTIAVPFPPTPNFKDRERKGWMPAFAIEKLEEDLDGFALPKCRRRARVVFGEPIDRSQADPSASPTTMAAETTDRLEAAIKELMREGA